MDIAIDLGSDRTRVFIQGKGKVLDEASVVTYDIDTEEVFAVGNDAYDMIGKTPVGIKAVHPIDGGVIARPSLVEEMVCVLLKEVCSVKVVMPRVVASVPCNMTEVEKRAIVNAVSAFGVRKVFLIESPKAAAMGCGIDITTPHGVLVADIGSGTADIAVLSLGGISVSRSIKNCGSKMDEEIIKYIRKKYQLIIGTNMAEKAKIAVGCVKLPPEEKVFRVKGRDAVSGLPRFVDVKSSEIMEAISEIAENIANAIRDILEETPPELTGDIHTDGIILSGGLAKLYGFARLVSEKTKLRVRVHKESADCVIMGCGKAIKYIDEASKPDSTAITPVLAAF
ncbi:MAG: rod shape-determining protein [Ruminococcus sp.]|nr:rod shape-determining protein [Ruminococcus sp.]